MLRVNVGLSRKLSQDYNSTGYSINLDGEITAPVNDPEAFVEQVKELYDLAEEALNQEIDRCQRGAAVASRDEETPRGPNTDRGNGHSGQTANGNGRQDAEVATNKQVQYLLSIGKRQRLTTVQLEHRIKEILGQAVGVYDLTKRDAGTVIDALTGNGEARRSYSSSAWAIQREIY